MGEMSELFLGFDAGDMFRRDMDAVMRGKRFVSEDTDYLDSMPLRPSATDLYEPTCTPALDSREVRRTRHTVTRRKENKHMAINPNNNNPTKVITGKCRLSYEHIWEAASMDGNSEPKYSASVIIPKSDTATLRKIEAAVEAAVQQGIKDKWKGKKPVNLKLPLRDGDTERPDDEAYAGGMFVNASSKRQPGIVDMTRQEIIDRDEVYSGCYCRFSLNFYPFSVNGNNGVAVGLNGVQLVADGEPLGGMSRAEVDFDDGFEDDFDDLT